MNKSIIILISLFLSSQFIESRPRYGYEFWGKFLESSEESSQSYSFESCIGCNHVNIGNGAGNLNIVHYHTNPNFINQGQTDWYQDIQKLMALRQLTTTPSSNQANNELQESNRNNSNKRPNNNNNSQGSGNIGNFGNGNNNSNTFNIKRKDK